MAKLEVTTNNSGEKPVKQSQTLIGTEGQDLNTTVELTQLDPATGKPTGNSQTIKITNS